jgi:parvulin-like peptidyl-prolyl isomerase
MTLLPSRSALSSFVLAAVLAGSMALVFTGCQAPEAGVGGVPKGGPTVLTVNGQSVTKNEYDDIFNFYSKLMKVNTNPEAIGNPVVQEVLKNMSLNQLILMALVEQEAKTKAVAVENGELDKQLQQQTKLAGGAEALRNLLKEQNMTPEEFKKSIEKQLLINKLIDTEAGPKVAVPDSEAEAFFNSHITEFTMPYSIRARHILVKAMVAEIRNEIQEKNPKIEQAELQTKVDEEMKARRAKAEKLMAEVKAKPEALGALAQKNSDDKLSAAQKGDLGFLTERYTDPAFWAAAMKTDAGKLFPILVESPYGFHILVVDEKKEPHKQIFAEAKPQIVAQLGQEKRTQFISQWIEGKKKSVAINIEPEYQPKSMKNLKPGEKATAPSAAAPAPTAEAPKAKQAG